jgi:hypothetical protein
VPKKKEDRERPADIELGAAVRMKKLRFEEKSDVETNTQGEPSYESETTDERDNLPDEVEPGETYENAWIEKHVSIRLVDAD